jgi:hypothetical protein
LKAEIDALEEFMNLSHLTNQTLLLHAKSLSHRERHLTTQILWHLSD